MKEKLIFDVLVLSVSAISQMEVIFEMEKHYFADGLRE
jgi:hypothetical protein